MRLHQALQARVKALRIAISSHNLSLEPFESVLEKICKEFKAWEIIAEYEHSLPKIKSELQVAIDSYDIRFSIHSPLSDINIASLNENLRKASINELRKGIEISSMLGIELFTFHAGLLSPLGVLAVEKVRDVNKKSIKEISRFGEEYSINLALENFPKHSWCLCQSYDEIAETIEGTGINICFDVGHAFTTGEIENFLCNHERIANVHLHDNYGGRDIHLPLGKGRIDFKTIVPKLLKVYKGDLVIEAGSISEGVKGREFLERIISSQ